MNSIINQLSKTILFVVATLELIISLKYCIWEAYEVSHSFVIGWWYGPQSSVIGGTWWPDVKNTCKSW